MILQDAKIIKDTQEKLKHLLDIFEDIMSSSSSNIGYTKLIEMDTETDPTLPPIDFKPYILPLKHKAWLEKN